ncbi:MAG: hypothetical protein ABJC07_00640 [Acidobacteriota bacterium]
MIFLALSLALLAAPAAEAAAAPQTQADEYTRYELLGPETSQFRVVYDVTATSWGATRYFNPIRKGSEASRESVTDRMTGDALKFDVVSAEEARSTGFGEAEAGTQYIRVTLPRPVPPGGQVRLRIDKTYRDPASYLREGDEIVFQCSLGIKRNTIVLPAGYELVRCNVPSQVLMEPGGRLAISFVNSNPEAAMLSVRARRLPQ